MKIFQLFTLFLNIKLYSDFSLSLKIPHHNSKIFFYCFFLHSQKNKKKKSSRRFLLFIFLDPTRLKTRLRLKIKWENFSSRCAAQGNFFFVESLENFETTKMLELFFSSMFV